MSGIDRTPWIEELFEEGHPNPERVGCAPVQPYLDALAARRPPFDQFDSTHPVLQHVAQCSECVRAVRARQLTALKTRRHTTGWAALAAAAVLLLAIGTLRLWPELLDGWHTRTKSASFPSKLHLDLRRYSPQRGDPVSATAAPLELAPAAVQATIILPTGSQIGTYDVQLFTDTDLSTSHLRLRADARRDEYLTVIDLPLDLTHVPRGTYRLALRCDSPEWHLYPAVVR